MTKNCDLLKNDSMHSRLMTICSCIVCEDGTCEVKLYIKDNLEFCPHCDQFHVKDSVIQNKHAVAFHVENSE